MALGPATLTPVSCSRPVWFGAEGRPAFGWFHSPPDGLARGGVVICPPVAFNLFHTHYALRLLAERLAASGFCAVRFDYDGTGDSAGANDDPSRTEAWLATIQSALRLVRQTGVDNVGLVGMRFGATLAAQAAASDSHVDQVVLWDPCASGRSFLREQRAISTITLGSSTESPDGSVEIPGTLYDATTAEDIEAVSIAKCALPLGRRVLVLTRADRPVHRSLLNPALAGEELSCQEATGQAEFMDRYPPVQELPHAAITGIVDWLGAGAGAAEVAVQVPEEGGPRQVEQGWRGSRTVEEPVRVPPVGLFGILAHSHDVPVPGAPAALFLNVANQHHVGPNRLWVELARQWAGAGIRSLRLDLSGLGDSPHRQGSPGRWECFKPEAFDDVVDAARWLSPDDPSNVVLVGLCSGGYQALEGALVLRARGVVAINPFGSFDPAELRAGLPLDPRRQVLLSTAGSEDARPGEARLDEARLDEARLDEARLDEARLEEAWRAGIAGRGGRSSGRWLTDLVQQGTDTLLVCGDAELRAARRGIAAARLERLSRTGGLRLEHVAGLQHDLFIADQRRLVTQLVTEHVLSHFSAPPYPRAISGPPWAAALVEQ